MLLVCLEVGHDRELLCVAPAAGVALLTVAPLVVILYAQDRLEGLEVLVQLVPLATYKWARVPLHHFMFCTCISRWLG